MRGRPGAITKLAGRAVLSGSKATMVADDDITAAQVVLRRENCFRASEDVGCFLSLEVAGTSAMIVHGIPVVRVTLRGRTESGRRFQRTVTAGMDPVVQLLSSRSVSEHLAETVRGFIPEESKRLSRIVLGAAKEFCEDEELSGSVRDRLREERDRRMKKERDTLVQSMLQLVACGWTREDLISAVDETTVAEVLRF